MQKNRVTITLLETKIYYGIGFKMNCVNDSNYTLPKLKGTGDEDLNPSCL